MDLHHLCYNFGAEICWKCKTYLEVTYFIFQRPLQKPLPPNPGCCSLHLICLFKELMHLRMMTQQSNFLLQGCNLYFCSLCTVLMRINIDQTHKKQFPEECLKHYSIFHGCVMHI